jgi:hypothetical protein
MIPIGPETDPLLERLTFPQGMDSSPVWQIPEKSMHSQKDTSQYKRPGLLFLHPSKKEHQAFLAKRS